MDLRQTTETIVGIAQEAGAQVLPLYARLAATHKYDGSLVTEADAASEELIRRRLREHFPDHAVYGEETGLQGPEDSPYRWYVDPIDGTSNYVFGIPVWGVSIGLTREGRCVAGAFEMPAIGETYWAWEGGGAFCNGQPLHPSETSEMNLSDLVSISSLRSGCYECGFVQKHRCLGSAAHALAATAAGCFVGMVHANWRLHDIAACLVMCQEVGLVVTTLDGRPFTDFRGLDPDAVAPAMVLAPPAIHARLLEAVQPKK